MPTRFSAVNLEAVSHEALNVPICNVKLKSIYFRLLSNLPEESELTAYNTSHTICTRLYNTCFVVVILFAAT